MVKFNQKNLDQLRKGKIIVDGRNVGWASEKFFARNQISVANEVSLVKNSSYSFPTRYAINYATDAHGTAINPNKVHVSRKYVSTNPGKVTYSYGKAKAEVDIDVHDGDMASPSVTPKKAFKTISTWNGGSKGSSRNWNRAHGYRSETTSNTFKSNGLTLRTCLFQPRFLSLGYGQAGDAMGQVGVIPEGMTVNNGIFTTSLFTSSNSQY